MFSFSQREKRQGNLLKILKIMYLHRKFTPDIAFFYFLKIKGCTRDVVGCSNNLLTSEANFDLGDNLITK